MKRTIEILKLNIVRLMNLNNMTYGQIDRMQVRDEAHVTGRMLRLIVKGEREPGLEKLDAIADLFGVETSDMLERNINRNSENTLSRKAQQLLENYHSCNDVGKKAIELTARSISTANNTKKDINKER
jgi:transcriptional regulator with XRE-family HTH domain